jgi:cytochrome c-type biogenesis protein CcmE
MVRMARSRRRTIRLTVALTAAILLSGALLYTSFSQSSQTLTPAQLLATAEAGEVYELTGKVAADSWTHEGTVHTFSVENRTGGGEPVPVRYVGSVPDPFREGREIIVKVRRDGEGFVGEKDSLITKCPSKFEEDAPGDGSGMSS